MNKIILNKTLNKLNIAKTYTKVYGFIKTIKSKRSMDPCARIAIKKMSWPLGAMIYDISLTLIKKIVRKLISKSLADRHRM